jgi:hypothetical protein
MCYRLVANIYAIDRLRKVFSIFFLKKNKLLFRKPALLFSRSVFEK